jgi:hypothetical protein
MARLTCRSLVWLLPLAVLGCGSVTPASGDASGERPPTADGATTDRPAGDLATAAPEIGAPSDGATVDLGLGDDARPEPGDDGRTATADAAAEASADAAAEAGADAAVEAGFDAAAEARPDAAADGGPTDAAPEVATCPADKPVRDNGLCCPTGQRNCGGSCVACAAGSVCAGNVCGCPTTSQCAPAIPSGWLGPVAADLSGQNAACGAAYPTSISAGTNPRGAPATCSCTCGACAGGTCEVFADGFAGSSDCSGPANTTLDIGGSINHCVDSVPNGSLYSIRGVASMAGASCASTRNAVTSAPPTWGTSTRLCTGAVVTPGACAGGEICAPLTAPQKTCVYHTGTMACPAGYPVSSTQYLGFSDTRDCACGCDPTTATCTPSVSFVATTNGCTADTGVVFPHCGSVFAGSTHGFRIDSLNVTVRGAPSFTSSGGVTPASPITVCCTN